MAPIITVSISEADEAAAIAALGLIILILPQVVLVSLGLNCRKLFDDFPIGTLGLAVEHNPQPSLLSHPPICLRLYPKKTQMMY